MTQYTFQLRGQRLSASTLERLSSMYAKIRDDSGEGASTFPHVNVEEGGKIVACISYNAKIWRGAKGMLNSANLVLLFDPYSLDEALKMRVIGEFTPDMLRLIRKLAGMHAEVRGQRL